MAVTRENFHLIIDNVEIGTQVDVRFLVSTKEVYRTSENKFIITCMVSGWNEAVVSKTELLKAMSDTEFYNNLDWQ